MRKLRLGKHATPNSFDAILASSPKNTILYPISNIKIAPGYRCFKSRICYLLSVSDHNDKLPVTGKRQSIYAIAPRILSRPRHVLRLAIRIHGLLCRKAISPLCKYLTLSTQLENVLLFVLLTLPDLPCTCASMVRFEGATVLI